MSEPEAPKTGVGATEQIMAALFALVSSSAAFKTKSRKLKLWADVPKTDRPAIFQHELDEDYSGGNEGSPSKVQLNVELFIYTDAENNRVPAARLNNVLDAVRIALRPSMMTGKQTLGGLVDNVWINGKVFKDPGDIDGDGLAIVPVAILVPSLTLSTPTNS